MKKHYLKKITKILFFVIPMLLFSSQVIFSQNITINSDGDLDEGSTTNLTATLDAAISNDVYVPFEFGGTAKFSIDYTVDFSTKGEETVLLDMGENDYGRMKTLPNGNIIFINGSQLKIYNPATQELTEKNLNEGFDRLEVVSNTVLYGHNGNRINKIDITDLDAILEENIFETQNNSYLEQHSFSIVDETIYFSVYNNNANIRFLYKQINGVKEILYQGNEGFGKPILINGEEYYIQNYEIKQLNNGSITNRIYFGDNFNINRNSVFVKNNTTYALGRLDEVNSYKPGIINISEGQVTFEAFDISEEDIFNYFDIDSNTGNIITQNSGFDDDLNSIYTLSRYQVAPQIKIVAGETSGTLTINATDDDIYEVTESIVITPGTPSNATLADTSAITLEVTNKDELPEIIFEFSDESISENSSESVDLIARISKVSGVETTIPFTLSGTATLTDEFTVDGTQITIPAGETTGSVTISTDGLDDNDVEILETIVFTFGELTNATSSTTDVTLNLVSDDDPEITSIVADNSAIAENGQAVITATINNASGKDVTVPITLSGTAKFDVDFTSDVATRISTVAGGNGEGSDANQLRYPRGLFVDTAGTIFIADIWNNRIQKWELGATEGTTIISNLNNPIDVALDASGNIYVVDENDHSVIKYAADGSNGQIVAGGNGNGSDLNQLSQPQGIFIDNDNNLYIADRENSRIMKWGPDATEGEVVAGGNGEGNALNQFYRPVSVYVDNQKNIYVVDEWITRVMKWTPGAIQGEIAIPDQNNGNFSDISVDASGAIYVLDGNNHIIKKFLPGAASSSVVAGGTKGSNDNQLNEPRGLFVDSIGNIYVSDSNNRRVQKYDVTPQIVIAAGETSGTLTINATDDDIYEVTESIIITPGTPSNATLADASVINLEITDNDELPEIIFEFSDESISENSSESVDLIATISKVSGAETTIPFTLSGTATQTTEYLVSATEIIIPAGESSGKITITTENLDDTSIETVEEIIFTFGTIVNATSATESVSLNLISDDNPNSSITVANGTSIDEGDSKTITLTLDAPTASDVTVPLTFTGTADFNIDFTTDFETKGKEKFKLALNENFDGLTTLSDGRYFLFRGNYFKIIDPTDNTIINVNLDNYYQYYSITNDIVYLKENSSLSKFLISDITVDNGAASIAPNTSLVVNITPIVSQSDLGQNDYIDGQNISAEGDTVVYQINDWPNGRKVYLKEGDNAAELIYSGDTYADKLLLFNERVYSFDSNNVRELYARKYTEPIVYNNVNFYKFKIYNNQVFALVEENSTRKIVKLNIEQDIISKTGTLSPLSYILGENHEYFNDFSFDSLGNLLLLNQTNTPSNTTAYQIDSYQQFPEIFIAAGETSGDFTFNSTDDLSFEEDETIIITPGDQQNTTVVGNDLVLTIIDNDTEPVVSFELSSESIIESSEVSVVLTATADVASGKEITIPFTLEGTANLDEYEIVDNITSIVIPPNALSSSIVISTFGKDDSEVEQIETIVFNIDVANIENATSATESISLNLLDNDLTTVIALESNSTSSNIEEDGNTVTLTATLETASSLDVYIPVNITGTAEADKDYEAEFSSRGEQKLEVKLENSYNQFEVLSDGRYVFLQRNDQKIVVYDPTTNSYEEASLNGDYNLMRIYDDVIYVAGWGGIASVDITNISASSIAQSSIVTRVDNQNIRYFSIVNNVIYYNIDDNNQNLRKTFRLQLGNNNNPNLLYTSDDYFIPVVHNNRIFMLGYGEYGELIDGEIVNKTNYTKSSNLIEQSSVQIWNESKLPKNINGQIYVSNGESASGQINILNLETGKLSLPPYTLGENINYISNYSFDSNGNLLMLNNYTTEENTSEVAIFSYLQSLQIKVPANTLSGSVSITPIDDSSYEPTETIIASLGTPTNASVAEGGITPITLEILDNDEPPIVSFEFSNENIVENASNPVELIASVSEVSGYDTTITLGEMTGTASSDEYAVSGTTITIPKGETKGSISISTANKDDSEVEILESIIFTFETIENATLDETTATLFLESDDDPVFTGVTASKIEFGEHETSVLTATINTPASRAVSIAMDLSGTANLDVDYTVDFEGKGDQYLVNDFANLVDSNNNNIGSVNAFAYLDDGRLVTQTQWGWLTIHELDGTFNNINLNNNGTDHNGNRLTTNGTAIYISGNNRISKLDTQTLELSYVVPETSNGFLQGYPMLIDNTFYYYVNRQGNMELYSKTGSEDPVLLSGPWSGYPADGFDQIIIKTSEEIYYVRGNEIWKEKENPTNNNDAFERYTTFNDISNISTIKRFNNKIYANVYDNSLNKNKIVVFNENLLGYSDLEYTLSPDVSANNDFYIDNNGKLFLLNRTTDTNELQVYGYNNTPEIIILPGETSGTINVNGLEDDLNAPGEEEDETVILDLLSPVNAIVEQETLLEDITLTILNNEITLVEDNDALAAIPALSDSSVAFGDFDNDGDQDMAIMGSSNVIGYVTDLYENVDGVFQNNNPGLFKKHFAGDIMWVDYNKDGFIDLIVSGLDINDEASTVIYENKNGQTFVESTDLNLPNLFNTSMDSGDLDNDGDIDFVINGMTDANEWKTYIYYREGNELIAENDLDNTGFQGGNVTIADNQFDGDLDIFMIGEQQSGLLNNTYIRQEGNNIDYDLPRMKESTKTLYGEYLYYMGTNQDNNELGIYRKSLLENNNYNSNALSSLIGLKNGSIAIGDYNNDGFEDMVLTGEDENGSAVTKIFNGLEGSNFQENTKIDLLGLRNSTAKWVDYDVDGDLDLFITGTSDSGDVSKLYRTDLANKSNIAPAKATNLAFESLGNGKVKLSWDVPEDDFSSSLGYVVRLGTTPGGSELSNTESNLENGQRLITKAPLINTNSFETQLDPGMYYWSVQSVDDGLAGSEFSDESVFVLTYEWKLLNQGGIIDRSIEAIGDPILKLTDIDLDNDMDLVYASKGGENGSTDISLYTLGAKNFEIDGYLDNSRNITDIQFLDFNDDERQDILINSWESINDNSFKLFNSIPDGNGTPQEVFNAEGLFNGKIELIDINNDGIKEVVLIGSDSEANNAQLKVFVYEKQGTSLSDEPLDISDQFITLKSGSFGFGNFDNDDDIDFAVSGFSGGAGLKSNMYVNETIYTETIAPIYTESPVSFDAVRYSTLDFIDYDADGDLDIALTGTSITGDIFKILSNNGLQGDELDFVEVENTGLIPVRNAKVDFGDYNGDGYLDILYSGTSSGLGEITKLVEFNPATNSYVESNFDLSDISNATIAFGDIDGDNDLDFTIAGEIMQDNNQKSNIIKTYLNFRNESAIVQQKNKAKSSYKKAKKSSDLEFVTNTKPTTPDTLTQEVFGLDTETNTYKVKFSWNESADDFTPKEGLTYALKIGTSEGASDIMSVNSRSNGYRLSAGKGNVEHKTNWIINLPNLPTGKKYYWSVQSIDAAFSGSDFAASKSFNPSVALSTQNFNNLDVLVYPNPSKNGFVNIVTPNNATKKIIVFDIQGRAVISKNLKENILDVSNLSSGVYLLKVNEDGKQSVTKLVIE